MRMLFLVAALVIVLGIAFLRGREGATPGEVAADETSAPEPGYVATDARIVQRSESGQPLYRLQSARIEQQPASGDVRLQDLTMDYSSQEEAEPWQLRARNGRMVGGTSRVELRGAVSAAGRPPGSAAELRIETETLDFDTTTQDIGTDAPVVFRWSGQRLSGRGLRANLKSQQVQLESAVHGRISR